MDIPKFLQPGDCIGICAPSAGVGEWPEKFEDSVGTLVRAGYKIVETESVRSAGARSTSAEKRGEELNSLFLDPDVKLVMSATGGDFLLEILPYVDWDLLKTHPKWLCGASDPTSLLFTLTAKYGIATLYGINAGAFADPDTADTKGALEFLKGSPVRQYTSELHSDYADFLPEFNGCDTPTVWKASASEVTASGICIGGCLDVLKDIIGTEYDGVQNFVRENAEAGQIWYFDVFSMSAEVFYRTLLQMRYAGWFAHTRAVLVGRVLFSSSESGMTYGEALERALPDIPYVYEMDIGHTEPAFVMLNGVPMTVHVKNGQGYIDFQLPKK